MLHRSFFKQPAAHAPQTAEKPVPADKAASEETVSPMQPALKLGSQSPSKEGVSPYSQLVSNVQYD
jgi:hypothetical protein